MLLDVWGEGAESARPDNDGPEKVRDWNLTDYVSHGHFPLRHIPDPEIRRCASVTSLSFSSPRYSWRLSVIFEPCISSLDSCRSDLLCSMLDDGRIGRPTRTDCAQSAILS